MVHGPLCPPQLSEGIRVWDISAGERHTLLLADGDCFRPIIYYSGQQVKEEKEKEEESQREEGEEEEEEQAGSYTQQPVLLPFCMEVSPKQRSGPRGSVLPARSSSSSSGMKPLGVVTATERLHRPVLSRQ